MTPQSTIDDAELAARLRAGDETAFAGLIDAYGPALRRLARCYVPNEAVAEEVVQETWLAVIEGIGRFEGRSSIKTWAFCILRNIARRQGGRERRTVTYGSASASEDDDRRSFDPYRFLPFDHPHSPGHWRSFPPTWQCRPDDEFARRGLAALSVQDRSDRSGFIATFAGNHRHVVDYLGAEVLDRQPQDVRHFFLYTSILDRLSGPSVTPSSTQWTRTACSRNWNARTSSSSHSTPPVTGTATTTSSATCCSTSCSAPNPP